MAGPTADIESQHLPRPVSCEPRPFARGELRAADVFSSLALGRLQELFFDMDSSANARAGLAVETPPGKRHHAMQPSTF
jgi:hypothetical protein